MRKYGFIKIQPAVQVDIEEKVSILQMFELFAEFKSQNFTYFFCDLLSR